MQYKAVYKIENRGGGSFCRTKILTWVHSKYRTMGPQWKWQARGYNQVFCDVFYFACAVCCRVHMMCALCCIWCAAWDACCMWCVVLYVMHCIACNVLYTVLHVMCCNIYCVAFYVLCCMLCFMMCCMLCCMLCIVLYVTWFVLYVISGVQRGGHIGWWPWVCT